MLTGTGVDSCPDCNSAFVRVIDSRPRPPLGRFRRKICDGCGARWNTLEVRMDDPASILGISEAAAEIESTLASMETALGQLRGRLRDIFPMGEGGPPPG